MATDGLIVTDGDGEEHDGVRRVSRRELITVSVNVTSSAQSSQERFLMKTKT